MLTNIISSGIGLQTIKHLAAHGAKVYFTARSKTKAKYARDYVLSENPGASVDKLIWLSLDLSSIKSVMQAVEELNAKEDKVDFLSRSRWCDHI